MKIKLIIFTFAALFIFIGSASKSFAQQEVPIAGGYMQADVKHKDVIAAAGFAATTQGKKQKSAIKVVSIKTAKTQIVAGINYQVCMEISAKKKSAKTAAKQFVTAVVYRNLQNKYSLTSWTAVAENSTCESN